VAAARGLTASKGKWFWFKARSISEPVIDSDDEHEDCPENNYTARHSILAFMRAATPPIEPRNAKANHTQPWILPDATPPR
jgi:hypothetical protein